MAETKILHDKHEDLIGRVDESEEDNKDKHKAVSRRCGKGKKKKEAGRLEREEKERKRQAELEEKTRMNIQSAKEGIKARAEFYGPKKGQKKAGGSAFAALQVDESEDSDDDGIDVDDQAATVQSQMASQKKLAEKLRKEAFRALFDVTRDSSGNNDLKREAEQLTARLLHYSENGDEVGENEDGENEDPLVDQLSVLRDVVFLLEKAGKKVAENLRRHVAAERLASIGVDRWESIHDFTDLKPGTHTCSVDRNLDKWLANKPTCSDFLRNHENVREVIMEDAELLEQLMEDGEDDHTGYKMIEGIAEMNLISVHSQLDSMTADLRKNRLGNQAASSSPASSSSSMHAARPSSSTSSNSVRLDVFINSVRPAYRQKGIHDFLELNPKFAEILRGDTPMEGLEDFGNPMDAVENLANGDEGPITGLKTVAQMMSAMGGFEIREHKLR